MHYNITAYSEMFSIFKRLHFVDIFLATSQFVMRVCTNTALMRPFGVADVLERDFPRWRALVHHIISSSDESVWDYL